MNLIIGDIDSGGLGPFKLSPQSQMHLLSDAAKASLLQDETLVLSWDLALLLHEILDDEGDREESLRAMLPSFLEDEDADTLMTALWEAKLPMRTDLRVGLRENGVLGRPGLTFTSFWIGPTGERVECEVRGGILHSADAVADRMTLGQLRLFQAMSSLGQLGADRDSDLLARHRLLAAAPKDDGGVVPDRFLQSDRVVPVSQVAPRLVDVGNGNYQVRPAVEELEPTQLEKYYFNTIAADLGKAPLTTYGPDGERKRVVFQERAAAGLHRCRELNVISRKQVAKALSHPGDFFGEALDVSKLCERVIGIGPDIRRPIPFIKEKKKANWFEWNVSVTLDSTEGNSEELPALDLKNSEVREQLQQAIMEADAAHDAYIPNPVAPGFIEVTSDLRKALEAATKLSNASRNGKLDRPVREVLLVQENLADLVFDRATIKSPPPPVRFEEPPGLSSGIELMPHQLEGYAWLRALYDFKVDDQRWRGSLLADDMGLGKTLQVLALLAWIRKEKQGGPHLIVAPVALLENWEAESHKFFGDYLNPIYQVRSADLPKGNPEVAAAQLARNHLVLVSYETLRRHEFSFARVKWDTMVLDEAQKAKNPSTQVARVVRAMDARYRLAMSGTPVENNLKELWTIYDWAVPGLLGSLRNFARAFIKPVEEATHERRLELAQELQEIIRPVFVRRMKRDVLSDKLPPLRHQREHTPLSSLQEERYHACVVAGKKGSAVIATLTELFGTCAHPDLPLDQRHLPPLGERTYPKAERLFSILDRIAEAEEKALIFVRWIKLQRWVAQETSRRYGIPVSVINGQVNASRTRLRYIDQFSRRSGFALLVLSARAAGVGLNITAANHVIHFTREWNPAVENQATDRAYRIGQTRPVSVYTITTTPREPHGGHRTVEQHLDRLLEEKRELMVDFTVPMGGFDVATDEMLT